VDKEHKQPRRPRRSEGALDALSQYILALVELANWPITLACACALMSRLASPLFPEDAATQALLMMSAICLGACVGKWIERRTAVHPKKT
jgi:hypothetical protein